MSTQLPDKLPLQNRIVIVTRPRIQAEGFIRTLSEAGASVIGFPTISIKALNSPQFEKALANISAYDWLVFTSNNAVNIFFQKFLDKYPSVQLLENKKIAVIGSKTAQALSTYGLKPALIPPDFVAESILKEFACLELKAKRFLLPGARLAREIMPIRLRELGAIVDSIPIYDTCLPAQNDINELLTAIRQSANIYLTFTSSSSVDNFFKIINKHVPKKVLYKLKIVCIGPVTAKTVEKHLKLQPLIAKEYTTEGMFNCLVNDAIKKAP